MPTRKAVLDTNILLLFLVASVDISLLETYKRVSQFTTRDVATLENLLQSFRELATTPHILSETDNFIDHAPLYRRNDLKRVLAAFVDHSSEHYRTSKELIRFDDFLPLGLSDCSLMDFKRDAFIVTTDFRLAGRIQATGGLAINFREYSTSLR